MPKEAAHSVIIDASQKDCYDAICDFESYPEWQKVISKVNVWEHYPDGRPKVVEYFLLALVKQIRYVIDYTYNDDDPSLHWTYVEGDINDVEGHYLFEDMGDGSTKATYQLTLTFSMYIPGKIMDALNQQVMKGSVIALKRRVEAMLQ
ncbi:SRPBCC family protein [candidate division CSSED10-310 bacterium]|uniref:SRPBCC family protein n=1 Tax=candidate division CSSED10-310 bacterium TaxID=2855610 RepID=A0ABV6YS10_UNCC1